MKDLGAEKSQEPFFGPPTRIHAFEELAIHAGMQSLSFLLDRPLNYDDAPDLFCLDLYKDYNIDALVTLAEPTKVTQKGSLLGGFHAGSSPKTSR
jgi:hypothetical protein